MIVKVPELWNVDDLGKAIVTQWYVGIGDNIKEDMPVCQIMAAKVTIEVNTNVICTVEPIPTIVTSFPFLTIFALPMGMVYSSSGTSVTVDCG